MTGAANWLAFALGLACLAGLVCHEVSERLRQRAKRDAAIDAANDNAMNAQADRLNLKP